MFSYHDSIHMYLHLISAGAIKGACILVSDAIRPD